MTISRIKPKRQKHVGTNLLLSSFLLWSSSVRGFSVTRNRSYKCSNAQLNMIYAPPGSGYARPEDEESTFPSTYDPMMEYPGTMRPGRTPENMPYQDLPLGDNDPDPVPWPHFQQIDWHHKWDPPHPHPIPMEEFIEMHGRWATPEMEAAMRAGVRRDVRERQEEEAAKRDADSNMIITDDDDDDDDTAAEEPISLGDGMFGKLGSDADQAITAAAVAPKEDGEEEEEEEEMEESEDESLDSFLLDLGLDTDILDDDEGDDDNDGSDGNRKGTKSLRSSVTDDDDDADGTSTRFDLLSDGGDVTATINVEDDDLDLGLDEDDELGGDDGVSTVPLEDFGDDDDNMNEDIFDDGGFDYDDGDFGDGGDVW